MEDITRTFEFRFESQVQKNVMNMIPLEVNLEILIDFKSLFSVRYVYELKIKVDYVYQHIQEF